jgi:hypothetical protein
MVASMNEEIRRMVGLLVLAASTLALEAGCGGAGPYSRAPAYLPTDQEAVLAASAREYDATSARSQPLGGQNKPVVLFGVVQSRAAGPGGQALLKLSERALEPHNVCAQPGDDSSCRVTVSGRDGGTLWALVRLQGDDDVGPRAVSQRSLVRIIGTVGQDVSPTDGAPVIHASWYRHFPVTEYVSSSSKDARAVLLDRATAIASGPTRLKE